MVGISDLGFQISKLARQHLHRPLPVFVVGARENELHLFGSIIPLVAQHLERFSQPGDSWVTANIPFATLEAVKRSGDFQNLSANFQKLAGENFGGGQRGWHVQILKAVHVTTFSFSPSRSKSKRIRFRAAARAVPRLKIALVLQYEEHSAGFLGEKFDRDGQEMVREHRWLRQFPIAPCPRHYREQTTDDGSN